MDSGSGPARVEDPAAARLLVDDRYLGVFGCFLDRDRSVREAADLLGRDLDAVLYRVRRLVGVGLLDVVAVERRPGRPVKRYRAPHPVWFVPFEALPYADLEETYRAMMEVHATRLARAVAAWSSRAPWAGYVIEPRGDGRVELRGVMDSMPTGPLDMALNLRLTPEQAAHLNAELVALTQRYAAFETAAGGSAANRFLLVASVPLGDAT